MVTETDIVYSVFLTRELPGILTVLLFSVLFVYKSYIKFVLALDSSWTLDRVQVTYFKALFPSFSISIEIWIFLQTEIEAPEGSTIKQKYIIFDSDKLFQYILF